APLAWLRSGSGAAAVDGPAPRMVELCVSGPSAAAPRLLRASGKKGDRYKLEVNSDGSTCPLLCLGSSDEPRAPGAALSLRIPAERAVEYQLEEWRGLDQTKKKHETHIDNVLPEVLMLGRAGGVTWRRRARPPTWPVFWAEGASPGLRGVAERAAAGGEGMRPLQCGSGAKAAAGVWGKRPSQPTLAIAPDVASRLART
ncbi:unnamed protein product, partial [Prorocentrum cordatum]